ncbi:hypothetical protein HZB03_04925 [Candidatus Woesearchaeota archaeon]|nr:hypothetical protein [Candidatus Woesearchaeota archaeon]
MGRYCAIKKVTAMDDEYACSQQPPQQVAENQIAENERHESFYYLLREDIHTIFCTIIAENHARIDAANSMLEKLLHK